MSLPPQGEPAPELIRSPATGFVIGLVGGVVTAFFGIGGGLVMAPGLAWLLRVRPHRATGTSLAVMLPTALAAALQYHLQATMHRQPSLSATPIIALAIGSIVGAFLGASRLRGRMGSMGRWGFAMALLVAGALLGGRFFPPAFHLEGFAWGSALLAIGIVSGIAGAIAGAGGGLVMIPLLVLLLGMPEHLAQAISLAVLVPASLSGTLIHLLRGNVIGRLARWMVLGGVLGAMVMAGWMYEIPESTLRAAFGVLLAIVGVGTGLRGGTTRAAVPAGDQE